MTINVVELVVEEEDEQEVTSFSRNNLPRAGRCKVYARSWMKATAKEKTRRAAKHEVCFIKGGRIVPSSHAKRVDPNCDRSSIQDNHSKKAKTLEETRRLRERLASQEIRSTLDDVAACQAVGLPASMLEHLDDDPPAGSLLTPQTVPATSSFAVDACP